MFQFDEPIHLVGVGCFGSRAARELAEKGKNGVRELHAWDGQEVGIENVGAQTYREEQVGMLKVDALAQLVREWGGRDLVRHAEAIDGPRDLSGVVFVGGGTNIAGIEELSKSVLKLPASVGTTDIFGSAKTKLRDSAWFTALGLVISGREDVSYSESSFGNLFKDLKNTIKSSLKQLMP